MKRAARKNGFGIGRRLPARVWRILRSERVSLRDKLIFIVPVALYWILPDLMPMLPVDDAAFTLLAAAGYVKAMERKYGR
ncbi:hypothetical protein [Cohnella boryungensis]|jgi:hypothetical protein|uniref:DUF1232 domain-containing protein n=1 Tax=Cohnella boryungensis TaxID=768479 RepID=A0ABV8SGL0_9BACL